MQDAPSSSGPFARLEPTLDRLQRTSGRRVVALLVLFVVATILLLVADFSPGRELQQRAGMPLPEMLGGGLQERLPPFLDALGTSGRRLYTIFLVLDTVYAVLFGVLFATAIVAACGRFPKIRPGLRLLALIPVAAATFDILENLGLLVLTARNPAGPTALTPVVGWFSAVKLSLMNMTVVLGAIALFGLAHHAMRSAENAPGRE
jgi:hypothetical protein